MIKEYLIRRAASKALLPVAGLAWVFLISALIDAPNWRAHREEVRCGGAYTHGPKTYGRKWRNNR